MTKITFKGGRLEVPDTATIPYIEGDGVGAEIIPAAQSIIDCAVNKAYNGRRKIEWKELLAGEKAYRLTGSWLPEDTMESFREYLIGIKGPLATPVGEGIRSLNVALRQELDLYVCLRPVRWYKGIDSPIKEPEKVNMHIFRENTEDIYAGIEWNAGTPEANKFYEFLRNEMGVDKVRFPGTCSFGVKPVSKEGSQRLVKAAIEYAIKNGLTSVTLVHKGNIMKFTEGGFKKWGYELAETEFYDRTFSMTEYEHICKTEGRESADRALGEAVNSGKIIIKDVIADAFLQNTLLVPEKYSVIATLNLNGDYISDQLAAMVGGIGISPGANINYNTGHAIFEATHGTASDIAGKNIVNPSSLLLSGVMMLGHIGWSDAAEMIENSLVKTFESRNATEDLARFMEGSVSLSTTEFRDIVIRNL